MDLLNSWLDEAEVRRLAARLMQPETPPNLELPDAGFGKGFVGYANGRPVEASAPVQAIVPSADAPAIPVLDQPSPEPEVPPLPPPDAAAPTRSPFLARVHLFRDWMRAHFAARDIFILDKDGTVIFDESGHGRLHFLARSLAHASRRDGATTGNVHVKVGPDSTLEVIPANTSYGWLILGAVVSKPLSQDALTGIAEALLRTAEPHGTR